MCSGVLPELRRGTVSGYGMKVARVGVSLRRSYIEAVPFHPQ